MALSKSQVLTPWFQHIHVIFLNCVKHKWIMIKMCFSTSKWYLHRKLSNWTFAGPDPGSNYRLTTGTRRKHTLSNWKSVSYHLSVFIKGAEPHVDWKQWPLAVLSVLIVTSISYSNSMGKHWPQKCLFLRSIRPVWHPHRIHVEQNVPPQTLSRFNLWMESSVLHPHSECLWTQVTRWLDLPAACSREARCRTH